MIATVLQLSLDFLGLITLEGVYNKRGHVIVLQQVGINWFRLEEPRIKFTHSQSPRTDPALRVMPPFRAHWPQESHLAFHASQIGTLLHVCHTAISNATITQPLEC